MSYDFDDPFADLFGPREYEEGSDEQLISRIVGRSVSEADSILSQQPNMTKARAAKIKAYAGLGTTPTARAQTGPVKGFDEEGYQRFLAQATIYGYTTSEVEKYIGRKEYAGGTVRDALERFEDIVATGYSRFRSAEIKRQEGGGVLSAHQWAQMPEHLRARFMYSRPVPDPNPKKYMQVDLPDDYVWRKGQERIFHLGKALEASFLGQDEEGMYELTTEPHKAIKRFQMLGAHQQVSLSGLPTMRGGLKAGPGAQTSDVYQPIRAALILGGEIGGASGQGFLAPGLGDIRQRSVREIAISDLPEGVTPEQLSPKGDYWERGTDVKLFPGHKGYESPWFDTQVAERVQTDIRKWNRKKKRYEMVPGYRWIMEQRRPVEAGGLAAKMGSTKIQLDVADWVSSFRGAGGQNLNLQMIAALKDPGGAVFEMFMNEYTRAKESGDTDAMARIRQELGFRKNEQMPGSYAELSGRARKRWLDKMKEHTQTIRGTIPVHVEQLQEGYFPEGVRVGEARPWISPHTGEEHPDIREIDVEYQAIVGDYAKQLMMEYGMKRPFFGPEEFKQLEQLSPGLAEEIRDYGEPIRQAYEGLQAAHVATTAVSTFAEGEYYEASDPRVRQALDEAELVARARASETEEGSFLEADPQRVAYEYFQELRNVKEIGDKPIRWQEGERVMYSQPLQQMAMMGAEGMIEETEVGGYLTSMHELMQRSGSPAGPKLLSKAARAQEKLAGAERATQRAQGYFGPPEVTLGGIATASTMLGIQETSIPGAGKNEAVSIGRYPTHPETWSTALGMLNIGEEEMLARGMNPERFYSSFQAQQVGRGDYDADLIIAGRLGIADFDEQTGEWKNLQTGEVMSKSAIKKAARRAIREGAQDIRREQVGGKEKPWSLERAQRELREALSQPTRMTLPELREQMEQGRKLYEMIGPYYTTFKRKMMAHAQINPEDKQGIASVEKLHQLSHGRAQRPELLPPHLQALQDLTTFTSKGGYYQRAEGKGGRPGVMAGVVGLRQYVNEALMAGIKAKPSEGRITPTEAAAIMAPLGKGRQELRELYTAYRGARSEEAREHAKSRIGLRLAKLGSAGEWGSGSIAGRMFAGQWATRVARDVLGEYDPLLDLNKALRGPDAMKLQEIFEGFHGVSWTQAQEMLGAAQETAAYATVVAKSRERLEYDEEGQVTSRSVVHPQRFAIASQVLGINEWLPGEEPSPEDVKAAWQALGQLPISHGHKANLPDDVQAYSQIYALAHRAVPEALGHISPSELTAAGRGPGAHLASLARRTIDFMYPDLESKDRPLISETTPAMMRGTKIHEEWQKQEQWPTKEEELDRRSIYDKFGIDIDISGKLDVPFDVNKGEIVDIKSAAGTAQATTRQEYEAAVRETAKKYIPQLSAYYHSKGATSVKLATYDPKEAKEYQEQGWGVEALVKRSRERMEQFGGPVDVTDMMMSADEMKEHVKKTLIQREQMSERIGTLAAGRAAGVIKPIQSKWGIEDDPEFAKLVGNLTQPEAMVIDMILGGSSDEEIANAIGAAGGFKGVGPPGPGVGGPGGSGPGVSGPGGSGAGLDPDTMTEAIIAAVGKLGGIPAAQITYERTPMSESDIGTTLGNLRKLKGLSRAVEHIQGTEGWGRPQSAVVKQLQQIYKQFGTVQQRRDPEKAAIGITPQIKEQLMGLGYSEQEIQEDFGKSISGVGVQHLARQYQQKMHSTLAELVPRDIEYTEEQLIAELEGELGMSTEFSPGERQWWQERAAPHNLAPFVKRMSTQGAAKILNQTWAKGVKGTASLTSIKGVGPATARNISEGLPEAISMDMRRLADRLSKKLEVTTDDVDEVRGALQILSDPKFKDTLKEVRQTFENVLASGDELDQGLRLWAKKRFGQERGKLRDISFQLGQGERLTPEQQSWFRTMEQMEPLTRRPGIEPGTDAETLRRIRGQMLRADFEAGLSGEGAGGRGGRAGRAGGILGDVLQEFSIGGAAIRMAVIGRYTSGQVKQMEAAAEPYEMAGLQYQLAMGTPYRQAMQGTMGTLLSYQAAQRSFQQGFGSQALKQRAGMLGMLGIEPSFEMGEKVGGIGGPILRGLGAGLSTGVLATTVAGIASKAGMVGLAGAASTLAGPLAIGAGILVGGAATAGQIYAESQPDALRRQYLEQQRGYRSDPVNIWGRLGMAWENVTGAAEFAYEEIQKGASPLDFLKGGKFYGNLPKEGSRRVSEVQEQYAASGTQIRIDNASMYLEKDLNLNLDPTQARELGALLTLGGYTPEDIYEGRAGGAIERLAPMAALGQAGQQMSAVERFGNYLGIAPGQGLQGWLTELPTVAQPAQQAQWMMASQIMGSSYGQLGMTPTIQQVQQFAGKLGQGVPTWQAQLQMQQELGTLPIVQALGYEPGSPMGRIISSATPAASQQQAQYEAQIASQYRGVADIMGMGGVEAAQYGQGIAEQLRGTTAEIHRTDVPSLGGILAELKITNPELTGRAAEIEARRIQWERTRIVTDTIDIPSEISPEQMQREQEARAGMLAGAFGYVPGTARARLLSETAPSDYVGRTQWEMGRDLMGGPLSQAFGLDVAESAAYTMQGMRAIQQGVAPQAISLATNMMMGQGTAQAFGAPMGIGQANNNLTAAMLLSGRLKYQEYQQTLSQAQYGLGQMGRSMIIGGFGFGAELQQARTDMNIPLQMEGAIPHYEQTPFGIQSYGQYAQFQRQRSMMYSQQAKQMGTGAWATQTVTPWTSDVATTISSLTEDQREQYAGQIEAAQKAGSGVIQIPTEFGGQSFQMGMIGDLQMAQKKFATWQAGRSMQREMAAMQYEQQQKGNEYAIAMAQMQYRHGMESIGLQERMWQSNVQFQRQEMGHQYAQMQTRREWQVEDLAYNREMAGLQYGWQMEDMDRNIMFATGRQKEQLIRQRGRAEEMFSRQEGKRETEESRAEETYKWQEEAHARRRQQFEETTALQAEQFQMQKRHMTESFQLQMAHLQEQADAAGAMYEKQKELEKIQGDMAEEEMLYRIAQQQQAIEYYEKVVFPNQEAEMKLQEDLMKANAQYMQDQVDAMKKGGMLYSGWWDMINHVWKWLKGIGFGMEEGGGGGDGNNSGQSWECPVCHYINPPTATECQNLECPTRAEKQTVPLPTDGKTTTTYEDLFTGISPPESVPASGDTYNITITVSGAGNPTAVATAVADEFERRINKLAEKQRSRGDGW